MLMFLCICTIAGVAARKKPWLSSSSTMKGVCSLKGTEVEAREVKEMAASGRTSVVAELEIRLSRSRRNNGLIRIFSIFHFCAWFFHEVSPISDKMQSLLLE